MSKQKNSSQEKIEKYQKVQKQAEKVNFLLSLSQMCTSGDIIKNSLETECIEYECAPLFESLKRQIAASCTELVEQKLKNEEINLTLMTKQNT